jgi:hypothetical protein
MKNIETVEIKTFSFKRISLYVQLILVICVFITLIAGFFVKNSDLITMILNCFLALTMFVMAYNNENFYKRKVLTYIYSVFGVILIISIVVGLLW